MILWQKDPITVYGFSKSQAKKIKKICEDNITSNSQSGSTEAMAQTIKKAIEEAKNSNGYTGVSDEILKLKKLLEEGVITQSEFDSQKKKLLRN